MTTTLDEALALLRRRAFAEAEGHLRALLVDDPQNPRALYAMGLCCLQTGRPGDAIPWLEQALAVSGEAERAATHEALAAAHRRLDDRSSALHHYREAARLQPQAALAALNLGAALGDADQLAEAAVAFARALALRPELIEARHALAVILNRLGRFDEAERLCREGLTGPAPEPALRIPLAQSLKAQGRLQAAADQLRLVLQTAPDHVETLYNLGGVLKEQGLAVEAADAFRRIIGLRPDHAAARLALCMTPLEPLYTDAQALETGLRSYAAELDRLERWADMAPPAALAEAVGVSQPFYLPYLGGDEVALQRRYGALVCRAMAADQPPPDLPGPHQPGERLRVGIVSGFFRDHANWRIPVHGWVERLDRSRFALFGYHTSGLQDAQTAGIAALFDRFVQGPLSTRRWREAIAADRPHVLIYPEIGMDPEAVRLAAQRLAPVQCNSWGHPVTSGLATMDFFLSSADMEPPDAETRYTERLVRLPGLSSPVATPAHAAETRRESSDGVIDVWCGQSLQKYLPQHDDVFARIAEASPACRFTFIAFPGSDELTRRFQHRLAKAFSARGLNATHLCRMLPRLAPEAYLAQMRGADLVLDSIGWSGCNSLLDALACGLPILILAGEAMRGRHGAALLRRIGLDDYVCHSVDGYVAQAVAMIRDPTPHRRRFAEADLARLSQADDAVRALEAFLDDAVARAPLGSGR